MPSYYNVPDRFLGSRFGTETAIGGRGSTADGGDLFRRLIGDSRSEIPPPLMELIKQLIDYYQRGADGGIGERVARPEESLPVPGQREALPGGVADTIRTFGQAGRGTDFAYIPEADPAFRKLVPDLGIGRFIPDSAAPVPAAPPAVGGSNTTPVEEPIHRVGPIKDAQIIAPQKKLAELLDDYFFGEQPGAGFANVFPESTRGSALGGFLRGSQSRVYDRYLSELPGSPNRTFRDFLRGLNLPGEFRSLAPTLRGERPGFFSPRVQYKPSRF